MYAGKFSSIRFYLLKQKKDWKIKDRSRFSILKFNFGSQQLRFTFFMIAASLPTTHYTVGALVNYKYILDKFGIYKHTSGRGAEAMDAEKRRTKKGPF